MLIKSKIYKILFVLIIPLILSACENSTENNPPPENAGTFPNTVGDQWVYAVHDSLTGTVDTMTVKIVRTETINGKEATVWSRRSNMFTDTLYVNVNNNVVSYYKDPTLTVVDHKIEFPLETGKYWKNPDRIADSSIVKAIESVAVPVGTYPAAYRIERNWAGLNIYGYSITWFVDNVGIVKMYTKIQGFDIKNETWELLSYTVL
jgi:hypothetical protein